MKLESHVCMCVQEHKKYHMGDLNQRYIHTYIHTYIYTYIHDDVVKQQKLMLFKELSLLQRQRQKQAQVPHQRKLSYSAFQPGKLVQSPQAHHICSETPNKSLVANPNGSRFHPKEKGLHGIDFLQGTDVFVQRQNDVQSITTSFSTFCSLVKQCGASQALLDGRCVHGHAIRYNFERGTFMGNLLIRMYALCGSLADALATFRTLPHRNVFSWNFIISGCTQHHRARESLELFYLMLNEGLIHPDKFTFANVLAATSTLECFHEGRNIHIATTNAGLESDVFVMSALVNMYGKCGSLDDARRLFDTLSCKDGVVWNAMIAAYASHGHGMEALSLYYQMQGHDVKCEKVSSLNALGACSGLAILACGMLVHAHIIMEKGLESELSVSTSIVGMYSDCRSLEDAQSVFMRMPRHDLVSWSAMICVNTQHGEDMNALRFFSEMHMEGLKPDKVLFISIFGACANLSALTHGRLIHTNAVECRVEKDVAIGNALINMYGKCGCLADSKKVFDAMPMHNVISWTAVIEVEAYLGCPVAALELVSRMQEKDVEPNYVSFVNILSACSHAGMVNEACYCFKTMVEEYSIETTMEHYSTMIDLFGRAGRLEEAEGIINRMSIPPNAIIWESLLSSCRVHGDVDRGKRAAEWAIKLDSRIDSPYVLLSNIYSSEDRRNDAENIWKLMFERGLTDN